MLKEWTPLGVFLTSLIPGRPCLGILLLSWVWTARKTNLGLEALLLCSHLALLSKMPFISLSKIFWAAIYLRVNTSIILPPLQSGTRWDSLVMRTKSSRSIQTSQRSTSILLQNPLEPLWARFPYQFLRNWNIKLGRTYPLLTSWLPLPRLLFPVMPLQRSVNTV